ncbi:MAG TPA: CAP domain-containing protein [Chloroflexota bacterium]
MLQWHAASLALIVALVLPRSAPVSVETRTDQLATLINRARVERGLLPLARTASLDTAAQAHSVDMVKNNFLDHTGSDNSTPQERADKYGYHVPAQSAWIVVEVISSISEDPAGPIDWWLNQSPAVHGKVLTDPRWREMGVGFAEGGEYGHYWTVLVGCRPGVLPTVTFDGKSYEHAERCGEAAAPVVNLGVTAPSVAAGGDLEVRWSGIATPTDRDWIGLYRVGDTSGVYLAWTYVSCGTTPLVPRATGWCWLHIPLTLPGGDYELRLHANDSMKSIAGSPVVAVTASSVTSLIGVPSAPDR